MKAGFFKKKVEQLMKSGAKSRTYSPVSNVKYVRFHKGNDVDYVAFDAVINKDTIHELPNDEYQRLAIFKDVSKGLSKTSANYLRQWMRIRKKLVASKPAPKQPKKKAA